MLLLVPRALPGNERVFFNFEQSPSAETKNLRFEMETSNDSWIPAVCHWLRGDESDLHAGAIGQAIASAPSDELESLIEVLVANFDDLASSPQRLRILMQALASRLVSAPEGNRHTEPDGDGPSELNQVREFPAVNPAALSSLYELLGELDGNSAAHAVQILAGQGDEESMGALAEILNDSPPPDWKHVGLGLSPLWKAESDQLELFFARLDVGGLQPSTLSVLLDLAGHSLRMGKLRQHPWQAVHQTLSSLLLSVTTQLRSLERAPSLFGADVQEVQRVLNDSVALTVSLCDALGLIGSKSAEESLSQALELSHRRIHTEAACALARLGFELGRARLIELASDPVARLRAVNYAEELGFADQIEESLRYPAALAESEMVAWLAGVDQFGLPPSHLQLVDARTMFWPSYTEPQDCYLFRYEYHLTGSDLINIGIAGPVTHAFQSDLSTLATDDVYAAFAGWQAEHEDIYEIPMPLLNSAQRREADRLINHLEEDHWELNEALALTFFLGEVAILAIVERGGQRAIAITDGSELHHHPLSDSPTSLSPEIVLAIYRGRKLLRTFNS